MKIKTEIKVVNQFSLRVVILKYEGMEILSTEDLLSHVAFVTMVTQFQQSTTNYINTRRNNQSRWVRDTLGLFCERNVKNVKCL